MNLTEDQFDEEYKPQKNHLDDNASYTGCMYETYGEELQFVWEKHQSDPTKVWTLIDGDEGQYIAAGFHRVNRWGFFITEKGWSSHEIEIKLDTIL